MKQRRDIKHFRDLDVYGLAFNLLQLIKGIFMRRKHFPVIVEQDDDGIFIVTCPVFKGCHSYGHTIDEAMENIKEAIGACLDEDITEFDGYTQFVGVRDVEIAV
ncbi:hypothetical protein DSCO28_18870 [Desulfosarcina ovata subsp. sediminis]|uniref:HicB-like antitoxin of toxin-antitoxin system domain-containing protein n=1 Tax=Desulfosarcina ovata subsp. sediminis TaxID=885957 RepID=A0A5K7ZK97_9BACT|nr:type II toxin-antitoxin system HicB family antitoxin [Desulfosarcina ovata]BBO81321.1 hypothetical protein DSCO28_18870 [Desulfosarcina ovata subsp. sediminis]